MCMSWRVLHYNVINNWHTGTRDKTKEVIFIFINWSQERSEISTKFYSERNWTQSCHDLFLYIIQYNLYDKHTHWFIIMLMLPNLNLNDNHMYVWPCGWIYCQGFKFVALVTQLNLRVGLYFGYNFATNLKTPRVLWCAVVSCTYVFSLQHKPRSWHMIFSERHCQRESSVTCTGQTEVTVEYHLL